MVFLILTSCNLVGDCQRFGRTYYLHLYDGIHYKTIRCQNPEDNCLNITTLFSYFCFAVFNGVIGQVETKRTQSFGEVEQCCKAINPLKMDMIDILDYFKKPSSMNFDCGFSV